MIESLELLIHTYFSFWSEASVCSFVVFVSKNNEGYVHVNQQNKDQLQDHAEDAGLPFMFLQDRDAQSLIMGESSAYIESCFLCLQGDSQERGPKVLYI